MNEWIKSYLSLAPSFYLHGKLESFRISPALTPSDWLQVEAMKLLWSRMDDACKALGNVWIPVTLRTCIPPRILFCKA